MNERVVGAIHELPLHPKHQPYPAYKPSGFAWLGDIPAHWDVKRLKNSLSCNDGGVWGSDFDDEGAIVLRSTDMTVTGEWKIENPAKRKLTTSEFYAARLKAGDLLITKSSGSELHLGKTAIVTPEVETLNCCFSNFMQRLRVREEYSPAYFFRILNCEIAREQFNYFGSTTTGLANLTGDVIGNIFVATPPPDEQRAIAAYLDRETARLDALVAKNTRLIELLQEKRTALISHAVTRGLDAHAPLKDSGVEWLGDIPAHWEVYQLRRVVSKFVDYRGATPEKVSDGIPLITARNIKNGKIDFELSREFIREEDYAGWMVRGFPEIGDVLVTTEAPLGETAQIVDTNIALAQRVILLKTEKTLLTNDFLKESLASVSGQAELWSRATGSTAIGIKASHLREILVPVPPLDEQRPIPAYLDRETAKIDALAAKVRQAIETLKEYRTALISAAVTGKMDVR
jgi:type I restriction enzyme S subunit